MSKILLYSDNHFSETSSVIRSRGKRFSSRIENQIETLNWINELAEKNNCERIFCLGDFFDKSDLTAEEITAVREIDLSKHEIIVGNHDSSSSNLFFTSVNTIANCAVYTEPRVLDFGGITIGILPYATEHSRALLKDIFNVNKDKFFLILSHNDIAGVQYGPVKSKQGYDASEILESCDLFINGHIHNGGWIEHGRIFNIGSVTGINFSNNAFEWKPVAVVFDTETFSVEMFENPYSFMFYSADLSNIETIERLELEIENILKQMKLGQKNILSLRVSNQFGAFTREKLEKSTILHYKRVMIDFSRENSEVQKSEIQLSMDVDYFQKFEDFILEMFDSSDHDKKIMVEEIRRLSSR